MKKILYVTLKVEMDDQSAKIDITDIFGETEEPMVPQYTGPLTVSIQEPNWISCASDEKLESWYIHYT